MNPLLLTPDQRRILTELFEYSFAPLAYRFNELTIREKEIFGDADTFASMCGVVVPNRHDHNYGGPRSIDDMCNHPTCYARRDTPSSDLLCPADYDEAEAADLMACR